MSKIFIISGPSGCGKTTIATDLLRKFPHIRKSISYTTRSIRNGEKDGEDYYFIDEKQLLSMVEKNDMIEHIKIYDTYYGTAKSSFNHLLREGYSPLLIIEFEGASKIMKNFPDIYVGIFVFPPKIETLKKRMQIRGEDEESIKKRMKNISKELLWAKHYDHYVVNEDLEKSIQIAEGIIKQYM